VHLWFSEAVRPAASISAICLRRVVESPVAVSLVREARSGGRIREPRGASAGDGGARAVRGIVPTIAVRSEYVTSTPSQAGKSIDRTFGAVRYFLEDSIVWGDLLQL
jgi:hypothetical protein